MKDSVIGKIKEMDFCAFDLETTGGSHQTDKIIEIGLVRVKNLKIIDEKDFLIRPEINIPIFIQKLTSINQSDVEDAPVIEEVIDEILAFMKDTILVAHNISFDIPFFNSVLRRLGRKPLTNKSMCTNLMTKYMIPSLRNSNLHYMCNIFNINHHNAHRALDDARACSHLLLKYLDIFIERGIKKINHLYYPRNRYTLDQIQYKSHETSLKDIYKKLKKIPSPYLLSIQGQTGSIEFVLPCLGVSKEITFIMDQFKQTSWKTATIKLYGPFLESLISASFLFSQIDDKTKSLVTNFLWKIHFPHIKENKRSNSIPYDFVIANHLVPEQFIIYPLSSLYSRKELVFRYPGHNKRLLNYIGSKGHQKVIESTSNQLKEFIQYYLKNSSIHNKKFLFFKQKKALQRPYNFLKNLNKFISINPNPYNYPKNYL